MVHTEVNLLINFVDALVQVQTASHPGDSTRKMAQMLRPLILATLLGKNAYEEVVKWPVSAFLRVCSYTRCNQNVLSQIQYKPMNFIRARIRRSLFFLQ
jgi:hypothetical protein